MKSLKPCPFCGNTDIHITEAWPHYAYCLECGAALKPRNPDFGDDGIKQAAAAWNRRKAVVGHWIGTGDGYADGKIVYDVWNCSECDYCIDDGTDRIDLLPRYCPNCGAKMGSDDICKRPRKGAEE